MPVLTRQNHERFFKQLKLYFDGESIGYVLDQTEFEYAAFQREGGVTPNTDDSIEDISKTMGDLSASGIQGSSKGKGKEKEQPYWTWNVEKRKEYKAASAKVLYTLSICIDEMDNEYIEDFNTATEKWEALKSKYGKIRPQAQREHVNKLTSFTLEDGMTIEDAWTKIKELRRRVVDANPALKPAFPESQLFELLLAGLPDGYSVTRATLDAQTNLSVQDKLYILQKQEDQLAVVEKAMLARGNDKWKSKQKRQARTSSGSDSGSDHFVPRCYLCDGPHIAGKCKYLRRARSFTKKHLETTQSSNHGKSDRHQSRSKAVSSRTPTRDKHRSHSRHARSGSRKQRGYHASSGDSDSHDSGAETDSNTDAETEVEEEVAAISREVIHTR